MELPAEQRQTEIQLHGAKVGVHELDPDCKTVSCRASYSVTAEIIPLKPAKPNEPKYLFIILRCCPKCGRRVWRREYLNDIQEDKD